MRAAIHLTQAVADQVLAHAVAEAPMEACGLLSGPPSDGATVLATRYHPARNALASATAFDVHPEDLVSIVNAIDSAGEVLAGTVHSHPRGPAVPSPTDVRESRYPVAHLVVSLLSPSASPIEALRAWRIGPDAAHELELTIAPGTSRVSSRGR